MSARVSRGLLTVLLLALNTAAFGAAGVDQSAGLTAPSSSAQANEAFQRGVALLDNVHPAEAFTEFDRAVQLDPSFVLARAYRGLAAPVTQGLHDLQAALDASSKLPEFERGLIAGFVAERNGNRAAARSAFQHLIELSPRDYRGYQELGRLELQAQQYAAAQRANRRAIELNPNALGALNSVGYAALRQGDTGHAIEAFTQYVRRAPQEPNAHDSLAEAHLAAGNNGQAEQEFRRAIELAPNFWNGRQGIAYARFYAGDLDGALAAFAEAKRLAPRPADQVTVEEDAAAALAARGRVDDAVTRLHDSARIEGISVVDRAFLKQLEARVLALTGSPGADAAVAALLAAADDPQIPPGNVRALRREAWRLRVMLEAQAADATAAQKTATELATLASSQPDSTFTQSVAAYAAGAVALARHDGAAAQQQFARCVVEDDICKLQRVDAAEQAGNRSEATRFREALLKVHYRTPLYLLVYARAGARSGR